MLSRGYVCKDADSGPPAEISLVPTSVLVTDSSLIVMFSKIDPFGFSDPFSLLLSFNLSISTRRDDERTSFQVVSPSCC